VPVHARIRASAPIRAEVVSVRRLDTGDQKDERHQTLREERDGTEDPARRRDRRHLGSSIPYLCDGQNPVQLWRKTPQDHAPAGLPHAAVDLDEQRDPGSVETLAPGEVDQQVRGPCRDRVVQ
jgi:hypothetical protein